MALWPLCEPPLGAGCRQGKAPGACEQQLSINLHSEPGVGALKRNVLCSAQHPIAMGTGERGAGHHQPSTPILLPTLLALVGQSLMDGHPETCA